METSAETPVAEITSINVSNLSYVPSRNIVKKYLETLRYNLTLYNMGWLIPFYKGENRKLQLLGAPLYNVTFAAFSGELTVLLGSEPERLEVIQLMAGRRKEGTFDGHISLRGGDIPSSAYYYDNVAYVQKKSLFIPGLTYMDMIAFAVELRVNRNIVNVQKRVDEILTIMNLHRCKNRVIPDFPPTRGELGCDMRRLSIALEIVHLPPLIVLDEPTLDFEPAMSVQIMKCLKELTKRGHIVICSMARPTTGEFLLMDKVVLLTEGYSIYTGPANKLDEHFCSASMGYLRKKDVDIVDFILDISSGIERPNTMRIAELPATMQEKFEACSLFVSPSFEKTNVHAFVPEFFALMGFTANFQHPAIQWARFTVILRRAVVTKFKDFNSLRALIGASAVLSSFIGYLQYGQGNYGQYCLSLIGIPFKNTTNVGSLIFFLSLFTQCYFFADAHSHCQKLQLFRYEQASGCNTAPAFFFAMVISETPFALFFGFVFSNILFSMAQLYGSQDDYGFFVSTIMVAALTGLSWTIMFCALFKKELAVRDMFFVSLSIIVLLSGFPFTQPNMPDYLVDFSAVIPTRWIFEALYKWYFSRKVDGFAYLTSYQYNTFDRSDIFVILTNFLLVFNAITLVFLFPEPLWMHRTDNTHQRGRMKTGESDRSSMGSNDSFDNGKAPPRMSQRESEAVQPIMFMRASTVTGRTSKLSVNMSQMGEENTSRGPTVMLHEISYRVRDVKSPMGYKTVLNRISGQFDWGKLNMIMGSPQCGKSTLMSIIAGNVGANAEVGGIVTFNGIEAAPEAQAWERCGYVPMHNEHIRDLTVLEVITFAMKLRCHNYLGLAVVEENVSTTIANLHLSEILHKKVKYLNKGEYKRLSIAEEMVHGPKLLLMDEPTTGVSLYESSILMATFREMVNADRTVVATMHQPSADAFNLFDSLLLLSKGRVIYSGRISGATEFFTNSPYQYNLTGYTNPADFLSDVSGGQIADIKGEFIDASLLENFYMESENHKRLLSRMKAIQTTATARSEQGQRNPMLAFASPASPIRGDSEKGPPSGSAAGGLSTDKPQHSFELESEMGDSKPRSIVHKPLPKIILAVGAAFKFMFKPPQVQFRDFMTSLFKRQILFHRACRALLGRYELIMGSIVLHALLALLFAWVNETITPASVIAYLGIGSLFLILANAQFIFYMFNNHHVFLKEHARDLYSSYTNYTVHSMPLYILKVVNAIVFATISWPIMDVDNSTGTFGFIVLSFIAVVLAGTMLSEIAIYWSDNLSASYISIAVAAGLEFLTSGLMLKAGSFPRWMRGWVPSISALRWIMQGGFICVYDNNLEAFPMKFPNSTYTQYYGYLSLFGWGGKTKWYCLGMIFVNILVFRFLCLVSSAYSAFRAKGTHKKEIEY